MYALDSENDPPVVIVYEGIVTENGSLGAGGQTQTCAFVDDKVMVPLTASWLGLVPEKITVGVMVVTDPEAARK